MRVNGSSDTWDVLVVGVRDNSHASTVMLAAELSHYTGMPTSEVELALMKGEVRVRAGLSRTDAENAALELDDRGAIVDLRLSDGKSGVFPILKPDASRRSGTAVGGFIDDSATPPSMSDTSGLRTLPLEPDHEDGLPPPPMPSGGFETLEDIASEPIVVGSRGRYRGGNGDLLGAVENLAQQGESALGHVDEATGHGPTLGDKQIVDVPHQRAPDSVPPLFSRASAAPEWTTEPPSQPVPAAQPRPPAPRPAQRPPTHPNMPAVGHPPGVPPVAYAPPGYPPPGMHPGAYGAPAVPPGYPVPPQMTPVPPTAVPPAAVPMAAPPAAVPPAAAPVAPPTAEPAAAGSSPGLASLAAGLDSLEVTDLPTAPKAKPKKKKKKKKKPTAEVAAVEDLPPPDDAPKAPPPGPAASQSLELDFEAVGISPKNKKLKQLGGRISGEHKPVDAEPPRRTRAGNMGGTAAAAYGRHVQQPEENLGEFILGADITTALPVGLAIGLGVGLAGALVLQRGASHEKLDPLEQEMLLAATNPDTAGVGDVRAASEVERDLNEAYAALKNKFLLQWLGIGIPLGLVLSRIPRRS